MVKPQENRRRGRPATGVTPKRYFRMPDEQWQEIVKAAEESDETASDFIRRIVLKEARKASAKASR